MTTIKPNLLLLTICILPPITLIVTYTLTEKLGHADQIIPFISSSINFAPESCIGAFGLSITAFVMVLITFIKYLIVKFNITNNPYTSSLRDSNSGGSSIEQKRQKNNRICLSFGIVSAFGLNGVAAFQYRNAPIPHLVFATMFFLGGVTYMLIQTYLDSVLEPGLPPKVLKARKLMSFLSIGLFIPYLILQFVRGKYFDIFQDISASFEIATSLTLFLYFITYFHEFSQLKVHIDFTYPQTESRSSALI